MLGFAVPHAHLNTVAHGAGWQTYMAGLAFTIALSGLGWTECGNDYTRYCPPDASKKGLVGWIFLGTAVPEILIMTLGAVDRDLHRRHRDRLGRPAALRPPGIHPGLVRGGLLAVRRRPALCHQQPRHVLLGRDAPSHRRAGEALPGGHGGLRHRLDRHDVRHLQLVLHHVPRGLRRRRHRVDRAVGRHLPGRLGTRAASATCRANSRTSGRPRCTGTRGGIFWPAIFAQ